MESEEEEYNIEDYYKFIENPLDEDDPKAVIELTAGPFSGMVYNYGEYKFKRAENEEDEPTIQYEFNIISIPDEIKGKEYPDVMKESFERLLAEILVDLVSKRIEESVRVDYDNTDRESDIDESFERRAFYKLDDPVSEG